MSGIHLHSWSAVDWTFPSTSQARAAPLGMHLRAVQRDAGVAPSGDAQQWLAVTPPFEQCDHGVEPSLLHVRPLEPLPAGRIEPLDRRQVVPEVVFPPEHA